MLAMLLTFWLETEPNCRTLHLLLWSSVVSAISLWQDVRVIWPVSSILWTGEWLQLPPSPASFLATPHSQQLSPSFLIPGRGWGRPVYFCQTICNFVMLTSLLSQDKEEKEKLMVSKAAVEESDKEGCNSGGEEIIELQEMRMSPIPSLRNRHKQKYYKDPRGEVSQIFS